MKNTKKYNHIQGQEDDQNWPSKNPYTAPDGYFEKLSSKISDEIHSGPVNAKISWFNVKSPLLKLAMVFVLISSLFFYLDNKNDKEPNTYIVLTVDEIYNSNLFDELDENVLIESYTVLPDVNERNASNDVEDFLINNNVELSLIINEL